MKKTEQGIERTASDILNDPADKYSNNKPIGFIAPLQAQFGLPHKHVPGNEWERVNGNIKLRVVSTSGAGIPSGSTPRVGFAWATTWQVEHPAETVIPLGKNLSNFLTEEMGVAVTGRTIAKHKLELFRLFTSSVSIIKIDPGRGASALRPPARLPKGLNSGRTPAIPGRRGASRPTWFSTRISANCFWNTPCRLTCGPCPPYGHRPSRSALFHVQFRYRHGVKCFVFSRERRAPVLNTSCIKKKNRT